MGVPQNYGYLLGGPYNKGYNILGSILGYLNFGKLPYTGLLVETPGVDGSLRVLRWTVRAFLDDCTGLVLRNTPEP